MRLPTSIAEHFRLVKDYINRYVYPHMRLRPEATAGYAAERLWGFHAQHKDAIEDYPDKPGMLCSRGLPTLGR